MPVLDKIIRDFDLVSINDFAEEALALMQRKSVNHLLVLDSHTMQGILCRQDLQAFNSRELREKTVSGLMHKNILQVDGSLDTTDILCRMQEQGAQFAAIYEQNQPVGILINKPASRKPRLKTNSGMAPPKAPAIKLH